MRAYAVSRLVNSPANDTPDVISPIAAWFARAAGAQGSRWTSCVGGRGEPQPCPLGTPGPDRAARSTKPGMPRYLRFVGHADTRCNSPSTTDISPTMAVATGRVLRSVARRIGGMERRPLGGALLFSPIIILRDLARARSRFLLRRRYLFDDSLLLNDSLLRRCLFNASLRGHRLFPRSLLFRAWF
jgi:hypothetical protein